MMFSCAESVWCGTAQAECFYDLGVPDSDEEIELGGYASDVSGVSSLGGSAASGAAVSGDGGEAGAAEAADAASSPPDGGLPERPAKAAREAKQQTPKVANIGWEMLKCKMNTAVCSMLPATGAKSPVARSIRYQRLQRRWI